MIRLSVSKVKCAKDIHEELKHHPFHMALSWVEQYLTCLHPLQPYAGEVVARDKAKLVENLKEIGLLYAASAVSSRTTEMADSSKSWKLFANKSVSGGASAAFKFTKPALGSKVKPVVLQDGSLSLAHSNRLADAANTLSGFWDASPTEGTPMSFGAVGKIPLLARMQPEHIASASSSFKLSTTKSDGWHPRHVALLSYGALASLSWLLLLYEAIGDLPKKRRILKVPLIEQDADEDTVKLRAIGLFQSLIRVWGRARRPLIKDWEKIHLKDDGCFNNRSGRRIGDVTWRTAVLNKQATSSGLLTLEKQADLRKCFELVRHEDLWSRAAPIHFPLPILRCSINSYRWPRVVTYGLFAVAPVFPKKGIVAGSFDATTELKVLFVAGMRIIIPRHPTVHFSIMVDDFLLGAKGLARLDLVQRMHSAFSDIVSFLQSGLHLQFANEKLFVVSNSQPVAALAMRLLAIELGSFKKEVLRLGVPFAAGKPISGALQNKRVKKSLVRTAKIAKIANSVPGGAPRLFYSGTLASGSYGAEIIGMSTVNSKRMSSAAASSLRLPKGLTHSPVAWSIVQRGSTVYPGALINSLPAIRYSRELWMASDSAYKHDDTLSLPTLVSAFSQELEWVDQVPRSRAQMAGSPLALAVQSFREAGFTVDDPCNISSSVHGSLNLLVGSPKLLSKLMVESWMEKALKTFVDQKLEDQSSPLAVAIKTFGVWMHPVRRLYHSKARWALSPLQKSCLLKFFSRRVVTGQVLRSWGFNVDGLCPHCGQPDHVFHRIFICPHFSTQRADIIPAKLLASAIAAGHASPFFAYGWTETPSAVITATQPETMEYTCLVGPDAQLSPSLIPFDPDRKIYGDGSGLSPTHPLLSRAGSAAAQFDDLGNHLITVRSPIPACMSQNAAVSERMSIFMSNANLPGPSTAPYVGDCKGALRLADDNVEARNPNCAYASIAREMLSQGVNLTSSKWVKAHTTVTEDCDAQTAMEVAHNAWVDSQAKIAAATYPISPEQMAAYGRLFRNSVALLRSAARMLALWPNGKALFGNLTQARSSVASDKPDVVPHQFVWNGKCWYCRVCYRRKFSPRAAIDRISCAALTPAIAKVLNEPNGHRLLLTADSSGMMIVFCARCGYNASTVLRKLSGRCLGPKSPRPHSLKCFFANPPVHPNTKAPLARCYVANLEDLAASDGLEEVLPPQDQAPAFSDPPASVSLAHGDLAGFDDPDWFHFDEEDMEEVLSSPHSFDSMV